VFARFRLGDLGGVWAVFALLGGEVATGSWIQGWLLRLASGRGGGWAADARTAVAALPLVLALNLLALVMMGVGAVVAGVAINFAFSRTQVYGPFRESLTFAGLGLGALPGLLFLTRWAASAALVAIEREDMVGAMLRSSNLVRGQTWRVALLQVLPVAGAVAALILTKDMRGDMFPRVQYGLVAFATSAGLISAVQSLTGGRLLRELNELEGQRGAADLAAVFE
jgi:hypothetical protein